MYIYFIDWIGLFYAIIIYFIQSVEGDKGKKIYCQSAENFQYAFHFSLSIAFYIIV